MLRPRVFWVHEDKERLIERRIYLRRSIVSLVLALLVLVVPARAEFMQSEMDRGVADTMALEFSVVPNAALNQYQLRLDLYLYNDSNAVVALTCGLTWNNPNVRMDSALVSPMTAAALDLFTILNCSDDVDSSNAFHVFGFVGARKTPPGIAPSATRKLLASYYFTADSWGVFDSVVADSMLWSESMDLRLFSSSSVQWVPHWIGPAVAYDVNRPCCVGMKGNIDCDPMDLVTQGDLTVLIDHLFISLGPLCCEEEADLDGDGLITIGDMSLLIDHLFISLQPLANCP